MFRAVQRHGRRHDRLELPFRTNAGAKRMNTPTPSVSVLCIGHAAYDLCMRVAAYPAENSKTETDLLLESGGGPAANAAWLLAHWGVPTALAAVVGDDEYGGRILRELQQAGVECSLMETRPGHLTPVSFIIANPANGSRTIINRRAPAQGLKLPGGRLAQLRPRLLLFDGHELAASLAALEAFPSAITVLDAGALREGTEVLSRRVHYLVCSERFAAQLTGKNDVDADWQSCLRLLQARNGKVAVVTLGEKGLVFSDGRQQGRLPALPVKAVDTTAAGDIFHGAFAFALAQELDFAQALRLATVAAGLSVQRPGGRPSTPELAAVMKVMSRP
jgi:sugar/nucleoside kinase (ribokinase family)